MPHRVKEYKVHRTIDYLFFILSILAIVIISDEMTSLPAVGFLTLFLSIYLCYKTRNNKLLFFLTFVISFVNISISYTDCILMGVSVSKWQLTGLRSQAINGQCAKSLFLNTATLNLFLTEKICARKLISIKSYRKSNAFISIGGISVLFIILILSFLYVKEESGGYDSPVNSPVFEYSFIIFVFVWMYSKHMKVIDLLLWLYSFVFAIRFLLVGDRSSVAMLGISLVLLYFFGKIRTGWIVVSVAIGVPVVNFIGLVRTVGLSDMPILLADTVARGLYVDTVSWAYYAGLSIASLYYRVVPPINMGIGFFLRCIGIDNDYANLNEFANSFSDLYNNGGGVYSSYFFAFGGYISVFIGAVILGIIIRKTVCSEKKNALPFGLIVVVYSLRWYLYDPTTLFRGCLLLSTLVFILCVIIDSLTKKKPDRVYVMD